MTSTSGNHADNNTATYSATDSAPPAADGSSGAASTGDLPAVELLLDGARAGYRTIEVLHGITMAIPSGAVTALLGANGAGKSTTLRVLAGLIPLRGGTLSWRGEQITKMTTTNRAKRGLMLVPDERAVFATLSVRDNLQVIAEASGHPDITPALEAFPRLQERLNQRAGSMSGGERRMLALARALLARPSVLMVDELSLGLSPKVAGELFAWLGTVADAGTTVILADQYTEEALALADMVYVLHRGEITFAGTPAELGASELLAAGAHS
ncbi:ATP-binding cassette domain-containing protein [Frankia sp. Cpl3]|uniref:ABC transporter ATP-binding protein n=1 Tax=Parafrankia colletiae TaxID=573497 RepID=UPI000A0389D2|nr:ATP-binding cassette domain-containing protein [Parafrankia colletiae]MCK9900042.1 ATP-binding cassette domain-containing protein [Frankia sp. Cpl3]